MRRFLSLVCSLFFYSFMANATSVANPGKVSCSGNLTVSVLDTLYLSCSGNLSLSGGSFTSDSKVSISVTGSLNLTKLKIAAPIIDIKNSNGQLVIGEGVILDALGGTITLANDSVKPTTINNVTLSNISAGSVTLTTSGSEIDLAGIHNPDGGVSVFTPANVTLLDHDPGSISLLTSKVPYLIANRDAEAGVGSVDGFSVVAIPNWTKQGNFTVVNYGAPGGFPLKSDIGPDIRGKNFFAGGPDNALSKALRVIDVSTLANAIDGNNIAFNISGFFGGYASQNDNAVLRTVFRDSANIPLNQVTIGGVLANDRANKTSLLFRKMGGVVPVNTRTIQLILTSTRTDGTYNDGYADNLALILSKLHCVSLPNCQL